MYPTICFIGICEETAPNLHFHNQAIFFLASLDGSMVLPCQEDMAADTRADYERRLGMGMSHRHAHLMDPKLYREYENDIAELVQIPPLPSVFFKIYEYILIDIWTISQITDRASSQ